MIPAQRERPRLFRGQVFRQRVDKIFRGGQEFGIAPVHRVACELRVIAKIFFPAPAVFAVAVGFVQPGYADARPYCQAPRPGPRSGNVSHRLMPGDDG
jgi:hypothetical protein